MNNTTNTQFTSDASVNELVQNAFNAFEHYAHLGLENRVAFLEKISELLVAEGPSFIELTSGETYLPFPRLQGEMQRTINQINLFVNLLKEGSWVNAIIDTAQPERQPLAKPDLRQMQIPLGVVGVFGASNFPFAFSVAGGDTIAALAAGCPVVFKPHPGHPLTSKKMAELIQRAAELSGMPPGVFAMIDGDSYEVGVALVQHPLVKAIAFTGSLRGGKALYNAAAAREEPIPVYAEMGSVNPVFILPQKLKQDPLAIAKSLAASNTLSLGQFCTKPGIIVSVGTEDINAFLTEFATGITTVQGGKMLTENISSSYKKGVDAIRQKANAELVAHGSDGQAGAATIPFAVKISGAAFLHDKELHEELFGPFSVHVIAENEEELYAIARSFAGQLTCSVWATEDDCSQHSRLFAILENKAGRIMINNVPTGVEVTHAMVHGGPYPATTHSKFTSVGSQSIYRFTRPVCYQNFPQTLLPSALKNENPQEIMRYVNGKFSKEPIV